VLRASLEKWICSKDSVSVGRPASLRHSSMERWIQIDINVSRHILWAWMPAIHAGMTEEKPWHGPLFFMFCRRA
jgi:hypothetical protein